MSSGVATNKDAIAAQMEQIGVTAEHFGDIEGINKYFDDNKINQLFNVSTTFDRGGLDPTGLQAACLQPPYI